uniref:Uncharacterized protein n=1 Tax=Anguilla anguilla TaxID=7936 RepID=A0A0E9XBI6_ANGAN
MTQLIQLSCVTLCKSHRNIILGSESAPVRVKAM